MNHAIRIYETGGPEVMRWEEVGAGETAPLAPGEARVRHEAIGLNFIDIYHRSGLYPLPLPSGLGLEGAGVVEAVGSAVSELRPGDRVAYAGGPPGAYAEVRNIPADLLATAQELFDVVATGKVKIEVNQTYALKDAAQAHRDLAARQTTGSSVLLP